MILEKIRNGDNDQLEVIYNDFRSEFVAWITHHFQCSRDEAKEVFQVSVIAFYNNIMSGRIQSLDSSIKTYLFAIGKNKFLEYQKFGNKFENISDSENELIDIVSIEKQEKEQKLQMMERCIELLGDPCKSLLELYYYEKLTMDDISRKLSYKNQSTTKNLKYKCLLRLRSLFEKELNLVDNRQLGIY